MAESENTSRESDALQCVIVTPETTILDVRAKFVSLPLYDGEIGIAPMHSPMIGRLGYGELRVIEEGGTRSFYIDGGFVQVADNVISVLTPRAQLAEELDAEAASTQIEAALKTPAAGDEMIATRDRQVAQARAQLHVARKNQ